MHECDCFSFFFSGVVTFQLINEKEIIVCVCIWLFNKEDVACFRIIGKFRSCAMSLLLLFLSIENKIIVIMFEQINFTFRVSIIGS